MFWLHINWSRAQEKRWKTEFYREKKGGVAGYIDVIDKFSVQFIR